jgi:hypothetical protein
MLHQNPFSYNGLLIDISKCGLEDGERSGGPLAEDDWTDFFLVCITTAPVFYCAAIYVMLSKT